MASLSNPVKKADIDPDARPAILTAGRDDAGRMMTDTESGEWLTYAEASERLGIKPESVKRRARSRKWPRRVGNDGAARVLVPSERLEDTRTEGREDAPAPVPPDATTLERAIRAESRADAAEAMLKEARDDRDRWREMAERLSHAAEIARPVRTGFWSRLINRN